MVVSDKRLRGDYPFEVLVVYSEGDRRIRWQKNLKVKGLEVLMRTMVNRLRAVLKRLEVAIEIAESGYEKTGLFALVRESALLCPAEPMVRLTLKSTPQLVVEKQARLSLTTSSRISQTENQ